MRKKGLLLVCLLVFMLSATVCMALESKDVYDITERQKNELKQYIDQKISVLSVDTQKFVDSLFSTFDQKMRDLTKNFAIQMAIIMVFATLLPNLILVLVKNKYERKILEYRYNDLLEREKQLLAKQFGIFGATPPTQDALKQEAKAILKPEPLPAPPTPPKAPPVRKPEPKAEETLVLPKLPPEPPVESWLSGVN